MIDLVEFKRVLTNYENQKGHHDSYEDIVDFLLWNARAIYEELHTKRCTCASVDANSKEI